MARSIRLPTLSAPKGTAAMVPTRVPRLGHACDEHGRCGRPVRLATAAGKVVAELHAEEAVLVTPLCLPTRLGALRRPLAEPCMHALPIVMPDGSTKADTASVSAVGQRVPGSKGGQSLRSEQCVELHVSEYASPVQTGPLSLIGPPPALLLARHTLAGHAGRCDDLGQLEPRLSHATFLERTCDALPPRTLDGRPL
eukprot:scaffold18534_cov67-Phaeocystis_antarctica.AAC.4